MKSAREWTKPYCGVQHYGKCSTTERWASVEDHTAFAVATLWIPGNHFRSPQRHFKSIHRAKRYAEDWVNGKRA